MKTSTAKPLSRFGRFASFNNGGIAPTFLEMKMFNFNVSPEDHTKIAQLARDGSALSLIGGQQIPVFQLLLSLTACHANGCPLDLDGLISANDTHKAHDIFGIHGHIDHNTGELIDFHARYFLKKAA